MNEDTRVAVCCYAGDGGQVIGNLDLYTHHECPVVILSPEDSKVEIDHPRVDNRFGGKRAYIGQLSFDRQRRHLEILLDFPEKYFFINDADSACLSPKLPDYLYAEPDLVWSMVATDEDPTTVLAGFPHVAFQPPYFLSRKTIEAMLAVPNDILPSAANLARAMGAIDCIDHYMARLTVMAGLPWRGLAGAVGGHFSTNPDHLAVGLNAVKNEGFIFIHGAKAGNAWPAFITAYGERK